MNNEEILGKAIKKVNQNGYKAIDINFFLENKLWEMIIFDPKFAKAFWGEQIEHELISVPGISQLFRGVVSWKLHLSKMVLEEEPLKYLEKFI